MTNQTTNPTTKKPIKDLVEKKDATELKSGELNEVSGGLTAIGGIARKSTTDDTTKE